MKLPRKEYYKGCLVLLLAFGGCALSGYLDPPKYDPPQTLDWRTQKVAKFFIKKGVADPVNKAVVVVENSRYPKIAAAQAVVESHVKPYAVGKVGEKGAYQVREIYWSDVSTELSEQTRQHSDIIENLLKENNWNWRKTLKQYNGAGKQADKYAKLVLANVREI